MRMKERVRKRIIKKACMPHFEFVRHHGCDELKVRYEFKMAT